MTYESGDAQDIWEALFAGNHVQLSFSSNKEAERLRIRLYQIKKTRETKYQSLGMMNSDEVQSLIFEPTKAGEGNECQYVAYLGKRKREAKRFSFRILTDTDTKEPEQE